MYYLFENKHRAVLCLESKNSGRLAVSAALSKKQTESKRKMDY